VRDRSQLCFARRRADVLPLFSLATPLLSIVEAQHLSMAYYDRPRNKGAGPGEARPAHLCAARRAWGMMASCTISLCLQAA